MYPVLFEIRGMQFTSFGLMLGLAFLAGGWVASVEYERKGYNKDLAWSLVMGALIGGIVGAKLYYAFLNWPALAARPLEMLVSRSGLVWYGGLIGGTIGVVIVQRRLKIPLGVGADVAALTVSIGEPVPATAKLLETTRQALNAGIDAALVGATIGDVGAAIQEVIDREGFGIVRELVGHGVGHAPHEDPQVPNYGRAGTGLTLEAGLVIAIEPMVNAGGPEVTLSAEDGWTARTRDGSRSAHFEVCVAVTDDGPRVLGLPRQDRANIKSACR